MPPPKKHQNTRNRIPVVKGLCRGNHTKQTLKYERISYKIQECDIQQYCIYKFRPQYP